MKKYLRPLTYRFSLQICEARLQGTGVIVPPDDGGGSTLLPLGCAGRFPETCEGGAPERPLEAECISPSIFITFSIPGNGCPFDPLSECTILIDNQSYSLFTGIADSCGSDGCAVDLEYRLTSCAGGETVTISCPGYQDCQQTVVLGG
ncbi:MAG: hypothetical protein Q8Q33_07670 [Chlamydiota bacterium]|nr:hypothetical protein [Chlamydiota bacterium]